MNNRSNEIQLIVTNALIVRTEFINKEISIINEISKYSQCLTDALNQEMRTSNGMNTKRPLHSDRIFSQSLFQFPVVFFVLPNGCELISSVQRWYPFKSFFFFVVVYGDRRADISEENCKKILGGLNKRFSLSLIIRQIERSFQNTMNDH